MQFGILNEHTTVIPDSFTVDLLGNVSGIDRLGLGGKNIRYSPTPEPHRLIRSAFLRI
jgi:hypothetical protein